MVDVDSIVVARLIEKKNDPKYLIGYLDEVIKTLDIMIKW